MTRLSPHFQFSQSSLQDYVDCARRFELRHIERLAWPAPESEPLLIYEEHQAQGARFHRMIHQHLAGIPAAALAPLAQDEPLRRWWAAWQQHGLAGLPDQHYPEITLTMPLGAYRLMARYDLIAIEPGERAVIVDWKTSENRPQRDRLAERLQTVVYRAVLALAGAHLNGDQPIPPEQIEMVYWFTDHPAERFGYSADQLQADLDWLAGLVAEIEQRDVFDLTADERRCKFCNYRSLCDRGERAGDFREAEVGAEGGNETDGAGFVIDLDQIAEIEF